MEIPLMNLIMTTLCSMIIAEEAGFEPAHRSHGTGFQVRGDANYALLFLFLLR